VHPVGDLVQSLGEVPDRESLAETSAPFVPLPVAVTSGVLVVGSFISGCAGGQCGLAEIGNSKEHVAHNLDRFGPQCA
jgi:hypothetical protein